MNRLRVKAALLVALRVVPEPQNAASRAQLLRLFLSLSEFVQKQRRQRVCRLMRLG